MIPRITLLRFLYFGCFILYPHEGQVFANSLISLLHFGHFIKAILFNYCVSNPQIDIFRWGKAWELLVITSWRLWTALHQVITTAHALISHIRDMQLRRKHVCIIFDVRKLSRFPRKIRLNAYTYFMPHSHKALQKYKIYFKSGVSSRICWLNLFAWRRFIEYVILNFKIKFHNPL